MTAEQGHRVTERQRIALEAELADLEGPQRTRVVQAIKTAREHGDLSENFEYHAAKTEQGLLEARIRSLRARLDSAVVLDASTIVEREIGTGSRVVIEDDEGAAIEFELSSVGGSGTVSTDSPLGRALIGHSVGDEVEVQAPSGSWKARIVAVRPPL